MQPLVFAIYMFNFINMYNYVMFSTVPLHSANCISMFYGPIKLYKITRLEGSVAINSITKIQLFWEAFRDTEPTVRRLFSNINPPLPTDAAIFF